MRELGKGSPTAVTGSEHGVKRRFETLLSSKSLEDKAVLDIGCGVGAYCKVAMNYGASLAVGLDINLQYLIKAKSIEKVQARASSLPFSSSCFDVILMIDVLEHLPSESEVIQEAKRVLKKDGIIFITVPNKFYPIETHGLRIGSTEIRNTLNVGIPLLSWAPKFVRERAERARVYTQKQLVELLREQGLRPLKVEYMMPPLDKIEKRLATAARKILRRLEATWLRCLGCHIIVIANRA